MLTAEHGTQAASFPDPAFVTREGAIPYSCTGITLVDLAIVGS